MKGSYYNKERNVYRSFINIELQVMWLGTHKTDKEAHDYYVYAKAIYDDLDPKLTYEQVGKILKSSDGRKTWSEERRIKASESHIEYWKNKKENQ